MLVLPVTDEDGRLSILAPLILKAIMTYPKPDDPRQMHLLSTSVAQMLVEHPEVIKEQGRGVLALDILPHVHSAPKPEQIFRDARAHADKAWIAGELLLFLLNVAIVRPEETVSVSKGLSVLREVLSGRPTRGGGVVEFTIRTGWTAWSRFKSVAPFHAVLQMSMQDETLDLGPDREGWEVPSLEHLPAFFALAEHLRVLGTESGFLDPETTWRVPEDISLPTVTVEFPPLTATALKALDEYLPEGSPNLPPIP